MNTSLSVRILLEHRRLKADHAHVLHAVVRLEAKAKAERRRPPLDLFACVDLSGSMTGTNLDHVRDVLVRLGRELSEADRLAVVGYHGEAVSVLPLRSMSVEGKLALQDAFFGLLARPGTNMSAGVRLALAMLRAEARHDAVRRVLMFTNERAMAGAPIHDRDTWTRLLAGPRRGAGISWVGLGSEVGAFLSSLAEHSAGTAYAARDSDVIAEIFARELGGVLGRPVNDLRLRVRSGLSPPTLLDEEHQLQRGSALHVHVPELAAEERKDLVFRIDAPPRAAGPVPAFAVDLSWRDATVGRAECRSLTVDVSYVVDEPDAPEPDVAEALAFREAARARTEAIALAEQQRRPEAETCLDDAIHALERVGTPRTQRVAVALRATSASWMADDAEASGAGVSRGLGSRAPSRRGRPV